MKKSIKQAAKQFSSALDKDDFPSAKKALSKTCVYEINGRLLRGPKEIMDLYEANMIEGRRKFDELIWGEGRIEQMDENTAVMHIEDYIKHQGISHTYKCKQILSFNEECEIIKITHVNLEGEQDRFMQFKKRAGLSDA